MSRQHFTSCFSQSNRGDREDKERGVEDEPYNENYPARHQAHSSTQQEFIEVRCRCWMQVNLEIPTRCQEREQPDIVASQSSPNGLPDADCKMRRHQVR